MVHDRLMRLSGLAMAVVITVCAAAAGADQPTAQAAFEKGAALYFEGKYADALVQFKRAHAASPNAIFQYNIAVCNLRLGRHNEAMRAAKSARSLGGLSERDTAQNDARIVAIPLLVAVRAMAEAVATQIQTPAEVEPVADVVIQPSPEPRGQTRSNWGALGWIGVAGAAVGSGLMVGALATEAGLQGLWSDYEAAGTAGDEAQYQRLRDDIESRQTVGRVLLLSGAALATVGAALIIVDLVTPDGTEASAALVPTNDGAAIIWTFAF